MPSWLTNWTRLSQDAGTRFACRRLEDDGGVDSTFVATISVHGAAGTLSSTSWPRSPSTTATTFGREVIKGMDEKVRQGWPTGLAPFGYLKVQDEMSPCIHIQSNRRSSTSSSCTKLDSHTFKSLPTVSTGGPRLRASQSRFPRTALSDILPNRFYVGELHRNGHVHQGEAPVLIAAATFDACQDVLSAESPDRPPGICLPGCYFNVSSADNPLRCNHSLQLGTAALTSTSIIAVPTVLLGLIILASAGRRATWR